VLEHLAKNMGCNYPIEHPIDGCEIVLLNIYVSESLLTCKFITGVTLAVIHVINGYSNTEVGTCYMEMIS
jgi:hypothetical protein